MINFLELPDPETTLYLILDPRDEEEIPVGRNSPKTGIALKSEDGSLAKEKPHYVTQFSQLKSNNGSLDKVMPVGTRKGSKDGKRSKIKKLNRIMYPGKRKNSKIGSYGKTKIKASNSKNKGSFLGLEKYGIKNLKSRSKDTDKSAKIGKKYKKFHTNVH